MTLVLDIDETLVHSTTSSTCSLTDEMKASGNFFTFHSQGMWFLVEKRPFVDRFLCEAAKHFEIIAFTAGTAEYADLVLDTLDPSKSIFRHRLYRDQVNLQTGGKDLRLINRDLANTILVDNSHSSFVYQLSNGVPITSFVGNDSSDSALLTLLDFLLFLTKAGMKDVREYLSQVFRLHERFVQLPAGVDPQHLAKSLN